MTFFITGGSSGIGRETVFELAKAGAKIHMLCRDRIKAEKVAQEIKKATQNEIHVWDLDLAKGKIILF